LADWRLFGNHLNKRTIGISVLLAVILFYAIGTGFAFFYQLLYALALLMIIGAVWAWLNLRGIEVSVSRTGDRGQVGGYLQSRVSILNRTRLPKSWLEVAESTGPSADEGGRGLAIGKEQVRSWRIESFLSQRGIFRNTEVRVVAQDPFGLFRFVRIFTDDQPYIVFPSTEPLPNLDPRFAGLPSDSRMTRHWDQVTTDVASVRAYRPGDGLRRIHWPYSARMNTLMVKDFDIGLAAEAWVILDMHRGSHFGSEADGIDNTEEISVSTAASIVTRLVEMSLPVGLAANGDRHHLLRPDSGPEHLGRLMEVFAEVRALGDRPLPGFLYDVRPNLNQFNTVTVVTAAIDTGWVSALSDLRRQGVNVAAVLVDPSGFGADVDSGIVLSAASAELIPLYAVQRGQELDAALGRPVNAEVISGSSRYSPQLAGRR
jgi:uncharacterized protein (DUF58 family)